jgi:hypothetical protein
VVALELLTWTRLYQPERRIRYSATASLRVRYLAIEVDDALELLEQIEL